MDMPLSLVVFFLLGMRLNSSVFSSSFFFLFGSFGSGFPGRTATLATLRGASVSLPLLSSPGAQSGPMASGKQVKELSAELS